MACCKICCGWFHFQCLGFLEGVGLLDKRDFVCCFCMASKTLSHVREVESLREEVKELCVQCTVGDEVDNTPTRTRNAGTDEDQTSREATPSYSMVVRNTLRKNSDGTETSGSQVSRHEEDNCGTKEDQHSRKEEDAISM